MSNNSDIKRINKSLEEGEKGFLLVFPPPPSGSVPIKDLYRFDFEVVNKSPQITDTNNDKNHNIIFTPSIVNNSEKASFISKSISSNINIGIKITSIHRAETQTLVRLRIKDIYNAVLYTDYILIICSPKQTIGIRGSIVPSSSSSSLGPNGGRILTFNENDIGILSQLFTRMVVTGPGIPENDTFFVKSFLDTDRSSIEILPFFLSSDENISGLYTFTSIFSCVSEQDLKDIDLKNRYIVLEQNNNWSYFFREKLIAQFVPNTDIDDYENTVILLESKNFDILVPDSDPSRIPETSFLYLTGRVNNDSDCINSI
jgi:hypothetical protein